MRPSRSSALLILALLGVVFSVNLWAEESLDQVRARLTSPTVTFSFDFPRARPEHYSITVDSTGKAVYESRDVVSLDADQPPSERYMTSFQISEATRVRIFETARQLNHFQGDFDYRKHRIAQMGRKTLVWESGKERFETTYNWSENGLIDDLTRLFQGISNTQEFARRLSSLRRHDKLGLEAELKSMEEAAKDTRTGVAELQTIEPLLRSLAQDKAVMEIARKRAERLLRKAGAAAQAPVPSSP
ncbi:MAG: hypothetical protein ACRD24_13810 [Terriglobales bacterium]